MNEYLQYRICSFLARGLPLKFAYWAGLRIADRFWRRDTSGREGIVTNLTRIYAARGVQMPRETIHSLSRKTYQYFGKYLIDFFRYARLSEKDISRLVSIEHRDYLDDCHRRGRGVIVITAHYGNWELGGGVVAALGYAVNAVALPQRLEKLDKLFRRQRERRGLRITPLGRSALGLVHCLRRGEVVALVADRDYTANGLAATFFGRRATLPRGAAWLSQKTGAPILPTFISRLPDDTFLHRFYPPITPGPGESLEEIQQKICAVLEKEIGENPTQWFIFEDFWAENKRAETMIPAGRG